MLHLFSNLIFMTSLEIIYYVLDDDLPPLEPHAKLYISAGPNMWIPCSLSIQIGADVQWLNIEDRKLEPTCFPSLSISEDKSNANFPSTPIKYCFITKSSLFFLKVQQHVVLFGKLP